MIFYHAGGAELETLLQFAIETSVQNSGGSFGVIGMTIGRVDGTTGST